MPAWSTMVLPIVSLVLTWLLGLWAWRYQLRAKRRTELAEDALLAFAHAVDVKIIRSPMVWPNEIEALRKDAGKVPDDQLPGESYRITLHRYHNEQEKLAGLRRIQLLCGFHFGPDASKAFADLQGAMHEVMVAAHMGAIMPEEGPSSAEDRKMRRQWQEAIWAGVGRPDLIAERIDAAQQSLETILAPHLRADASLLPVAVKWQVGKAWFTSRWKPAADKIKTE